MSTVDLNVGCFNIGIAQEALRKPIHTENFRRILGKGFEEGHLHVLGLCEVGAHKQGIKSAGMHPLDIIDGVMAKGYSADSMQAYMTVWHQAGAQKPHGVSLQLCEQTCVALEPLGVPDPQLVIWVFLVTAHGHQGKVGRFVQGQLHIRTPHGQRAPTNLTKKTDNEKRTQTTGAES